MCRSTGAADGLCNGAPPRDRRGRHGARCSAPAPATRRRCEAAGESTACVSRAHKAPTSRGQARHLRPQRATTDAAMRQMFEAAARGSRARQPTKHAVAGHAARGGFAPIESTRCGARGCTPLRPRAPKPARRPREPTPSRKLAKHARRPCARMPAAPLASPVSAWRAPVARCAQGCRVDDGRRDHLTTVSRPSASTSKVKLASMAARASPLLWVRAHIARVRFRVQGQLTCSACSPSASVPLS